MHRHEPRRRQYHSRSRAGCLSCKKRHVRCDEIRPSCTKCRATGTPCAYPTPTLSRDEEKWCQKTSPGLSVWRVGSDKLDPFEMLPIQMPFKSQELLHYFLVAETILNSTAPNAMRNVPLLAQTVQKSQRPKEDCVMLAMSEPTYFRSVLMLAGLHYMWKEGSLRDFEKSFFFHKQYLIQIVNSCLLGDIKAITVKQLKLIAILSIAESCVGNYPAAEAHLSGLLTLIDMQKDNLPHDNTERLSSDSEEALERLILVAHHFASAVKSRLTHTLAADSNYTRFWERSFTGISENLVALRLIPFYLQEKRPLITQPIIADGVINALRGLTEAVRKRRFNDDAPHVVHDPSNASETTICDSQNPATCTGCNSLSSLLFAFTEAHVSSTMPTSEEYPKGMFRASWKALAASVSLYLNYVLLLWNSGQPIDRRLFLRILQTIVQQSPDLGTGWDADNRPNSELQFWILYTTSFALATNPWERPDPILEKITSWIRARIRTWSFTYRVLEWTDAKTSLLNITWPHSTAGLQEELARQVWKEALLEV